MLLVKLVIVLFIIKRKRNVKEVYFAVKQSEAGLGNKDSIHKTKLIEELNRLDHCFWNRKCPECNSDLIKEGHYCEKCEQEFDTFVWMTLINIAVDNFGDEEE